MNDTLTKLQVLFGPERVQTEKDISMYFTIRLKTKAEFYLEANSREDLINIVQFTKQNHISLFLLGGGSNIISTKEVIDGVVVKNMYSKKELIAETKEYSDVLFSSGYPVSRVVVETAADGLEGFEYQLGLPGTVGGALYMNSKWTRPVTYFGDSLLYANIICSNGDVEKKGRDYFQFGYDSSILQKTKEVVLEAVFRLKKNDPMTLKKRSQEALTYRKQTQPFGVATCGCIFQNLSSNQLNSDPQTSAGYYIDKAGLKNRAVGDFAVSDIHANFIINKGQGKPDDLLKLIEIIKSTVKEKFQVNLKEEVIIV